MAKIIRVEKCGDCPWCYRGPNETRCLLLQKWVGIANDPLLGCPLEDEKGE